MPSGNVNAVFDRHLHNIAGDTEYPTNEQVEMAIADTAHELGISAEDVIDRCTGIPE